jgi:hypothetical protein
VPALASNPLALIDVVHSVGVSIGDLAPDVYTAKDGELEE